MPKVKYTPAKGLHQETGNQINLGHSAVTNGDTLSGATHGVAFHTIDVDGTDELTLPTDAEEGDVHVIIVKSGASTPKITFTASTPAITAQAVVAGDSFVCVYDGSAWVVARNLA